MQTATARTTVQSIFRQQISLAFGLDGQRIPRQSTTVVQVSNGTVTIRGETNLTGTAWAVYEGLLGKWQATVSPRLRVSAPQEIV